MNFFCCDLDNTLIYSYKHDIGVEKVLVELLEGKELSFMSRDAHRLLIQIASKKQLVPVTTRSLAQYSRIDFGKDIQIQYALVANGGILLEKGVVNQEWLAETRQIVKEVDQQLEEGIEILKKDPAVFFEVRKVDELFVFTKSHDCEKTIEQLRKRLDNEKVYIDQNGEKVYLFPKILNKGESLKRFKEFIGGEHVYLAAGDSKFDISMLEVADMGFCPVSLKDTIKEEIKKLEDATFTEEMLKMINDI